MRRQRGSGGSISLADSALEPVLAVVGAPQGPLLLLRWDPPPQHLLGSVQRLQDWNRSRGGAGAPIPRGFLLR